MRRQDTWVKGKGKKRMRILAGMLSFCVLVTACPDMPAPRSVSAAEERTEAGERYISGFAELSEEIREQTVPVGTALEELMLPDTLEAVMTAAGESLSPEDTENQPGDGGKEDAGENDGKEDGGAAGGDVDDGENGGKEDGGASDGESDDKEDDGTTDGESGDGENGSNEDDSAPGGESDNGEIGGEDGTEEGEPSDIEREDTETGGETADRQDAQAEDGGASEETAVTDSGAAQETHTVTLPEYYAEHVISVQTLENTQAEEQKEPKTKEQEASITIEGVTWRSEPTYDGNAEGTYTFTAVLPEGYALAEGVSLPQIRVTVEQTDAKPRRAARASAASDWGGTGLQPVAVMKSSDKDGTIFGYGNNLTITQGSAAATTKLYYTESSELIDLSPAEGSVADGFHLEQYALNTQGSDDDYSSYGIVIHMSGGILNQIWNRRSDGGNARSIQIFMSGGTLLTEKVACEAHVVDISGDSVIKGKLYGNEGLSISGSPQIGGEGKGITISSGQSFTVKGALSGANIYVNPQADFADGTKIAQAASGCTITASDLSQMKLTGSYVEGKELYLENNAICIRVKPAVPHTVTYDYGTNGGTSATKTSAEVLEGDAVNLMPTAAKTGWEFVGWNTNPNAHEGLTDDLIMGEADVTLYAIYKKTLSASFYSGSAGVKETVSTTIYNNATVGNVKAPAMKPWAVAGESGYTPDRWSDGQFSGINYYPKNTISLSVTKGDQSFYGIYQKNLTVTYDANGGTGTADSQISTRKASVHETVAYKTTLMAKLNDGAGFHREGYNFNGWIEGSSTGNKVLQPNAWVSPKADTTYYVNWKPNTYQVTLNGNGGSGGTNLTSYTYGIEKVLPTDWTKTGYTFAGWYTDSGFAGTAVTKITATDTGIKTYYAKWTDDIAPVIGTLRYSYEPASLWHWLIGKDSLTITVPVTEEGSGADEITYTVTPEGGAADEKTAALRDGVAEITVSADFKGTISIVCTDKAGNVSAGVTVGAGLDASGVIIEDNAPDIVIKADRSPSDEQQTQPGGTAVEDRYYETVPALLVTVKDDMDNAITGGLDAIIYQVGDAGEKSAAVDRSSLQTAAQAAFTIPASEIPAGVTEITIIATDNAGNQAEMKLTIKVKGPENKPAAEIDYREEKLTGLAAGGTYRIHDTEYTADGEGCIPIKEEWMGTTVTIVKAGNGSETTDSPAQNLPVPARPTKPTPTGEDVAVPGGTGKLTGLTADTAYEVSTDGGKTWASRRADANGVIAGLAPGAYTVRVEAGASNFISENSSPAKIGAYQIKVTFVVDGETCREVFVDYGGTLADIPPVPPVEDAVGAWCSDRQGTPAVFTNITADMTVYAVYKKYYTVTLQGGAGYTLSAETGSESPVKEGESFTFRFALEKGYQRTKNFAVKVNGAAVELTAAEPYTYTISSIRAHQTVTVEGVAKKPAGKPSGGDKDKEDGKDQNPDDPAPNPEETDPDTQTPGSDNPENQTPNPPVTTPANQTPPAKETDAASGTTPPAGRMPEGRPGSRPGSTPGQGVAGTPEGTDDAPDGTGAEIQEADSAGHAPGAGGTDAQTQAADTEDAGTTEGGVREEKTEVSLGDGKVIVTVVYEEEKCTAAVADAEAVAKAVLKPEQQAKVNGGETIEIRVDVTDISEKVPEQDKEVIESGVEAYREETPGLVLGMYVDISMFIKIGEGDWNAIATTDEPIEVVIGIPEKLQSDGREFYIIRAHEGEHTLLRDLDGASDTITVSTDMFSSYAIAYEETEGAGAGRKCGLCHICPTFLGICCFIWLALALAAIGIVILVVVRRRKEKETEGER